MDSMEKTCTQRTKYAYACIMLMLMMVMAIVNLMVKVLAVEMLSFLSFFIAEC